MTPTPDAITPPDTSPTGIKTHDLATVAQILCGDSMKNPERWVARQIAAGRFPARKVGRHWRMTDHDLATALDALAPTTIPTTEPALSARSQRRRAAVT